MTDQSITVVLIAVAAVACWIVVRVVLHNLNPEKERTVFVRGFRSRRMARQQRTFWGWREIPMGDGPA